MSKPKTGVEPRTGLHYYRRKKLRPGVEPRTGVYVQPAHQTPVLEGKKEVWQK